MTMASENTMRPRYAERVAVVTGGGDGIGAAMVAGLIREGARVVVNDLQEVDPSGTAAVVPGDVRDPQVRRALREAANDLGGGAADALFNNAGVATTTPALDVSDDEWSRVMGVNVDAVWNLCQDLGGDMVARGRGAILNTASVAGLYGIPGRAPYVISKHAVVGMTRALAVEWAPAGVRVNALCPGFTESGLNAQMRGRTPDAWNDRAARAPMRRSGTADEQAASALFLNSDEASYTTGQVSTVDGGQHTLYSGYSA